MKAAGGTIVCGTEEVGACAPIQTTKLAAVRIGDSCLQGLRTAATVQVYRLELPFLPSTNVDNPFVSGGGFGTSRRPLPRLVYFSSHASLPPGFLFLAIAYLVRIMFQVAAAVWWLWHEQAAVAKAHVLQQPCKFAARIFLSCHCVPCVYYVSGCGCCVATVSQAERRRQDLRAAAMHVRRLEAAALAHWRVLHLRRRMKLIWMERGQNIVEVHMKLIRREVHQKGHGFVDTRMKLTWMEEETLKRMCFPYCFVPYVGALVEPPMPPSRGRGQALLQRVFSTAGLLVEAASDEAAHLRPFCRFAFLSPPPSLTHGSVPTFTSSSSSSSSDLHSFWSQLRHNLPQAFQQLQQHHHHRHGLLHALQLAASLPSAGHARVAARLSGMAGEGMTAHLSTVNDGDVTGAAADPESGRHAVKDGCGKAAGMTSAALEKQHHHHQPRQQHHHGPQQQQQQQQQMSGSSKRAHISLSHYGSAAAADADSPAPCNVLTHSMHAAPTAVAVGAAPECDGASGEGVELKSMAAPRLLLNQWQFKHEVRACVALQSITATPEQITYSNAGGEVSGTLQHAHGRETQLLQQLRATEREAERMQLAGASRCLSVCSLHCCLRVAKLLQQLRAPEMEVQHVQLAGACSCLQVTQLLQQLRATELELEGTQQQLESVEEDAQAHTQPLQRQQQCHQGLTHTLPAIYSLEQMLKIGAPGAVLSILPNSSAHHLQQQLQPQHTVGTPQSAGGLGGHSASCSQAPNAKAIVMQFQTSCTVRNNATQQVLVCEGVAAEAVTAERGVRTALLSAQQRLSEALQITAALGQHVRQNASNTIPPNAYLVLREIQASCTLPGVSREHLAAVAEAQAQLSEAQRVASLAQMELKQEVVAQRGNRVFAGIHSAMHHRSGTFIPPCITGQAHSFRHASQIRHVDSAMHHRSGIDSAMHHRSGTFILPCITDQALILPCITDQARSFCQALLVKNAPRHASQASLLEERAAVYAESTRQASHALAWWRAEVDVAERAMSEAKGEAMRALEVVHRQHGECGAEVTALQQHLQHLQSVQRQQEADHQATLQQAKDLAHQVSSSSMQLEQHSRHHIIVTTNLIDLIIILIKTVLPCFPRWRARSKPARQHSHHHIITITTKLIIILIATVLCFHALYCACMRLQVEGQIQLRQASCAEQTRTLAASAASLSLTCTHLRQRLAAFEPAFVYTIATQLDEQQPSQQHTAAAAAASFAIAIATAIASVICHQLSSSVIWCTSQQSSSSSHLTVPYALLVS
ncbi:hypothetical protein DUNSADRAFT_5380 [Dunaliella salina]|uniref:Uncharacterized protein n=1 Tax=Dunaliella salina TaxID=3046 RepID=A0ABQ7GQB3_DUNSA|nr:hypothetical protein DUNSADRAFT_5380 [Dunaliella salina]|eukprot:KAF5836801.1 hypothetical protein DUNSADRAFT_5380 [Dunaliella salina]